MNEQWQRLQRNVGNIFLQVVGKILPYLNAVLMVLNEIAKIIAKLFGYKLDNFDFFDENMVSGAEDGFDSLGDSMDNVAESAEKLKHGLRGFDKLNVITSPSNASGVSGGIGGGGINPKLMKAFNKAFDDYQDKLDKVKSTATKIRDRIMEWLGFQKHTNKKTDETYFTFKKITGGTVLGALAVGGTIYSGINFIFKILKKMGLIKFGSFTELGKLFKDGKLLANVGKLGTAFEGLATALGISAGALAAIIAAIIAVGAALVYAYNHNEDFKKSVDNMIKSIGELWNTIKEKLEPLIESMGKLLEPLWNQIKDNLELSLGGIYDTIVYTFQNAIDSLTGIITILNDIINLDFGKAFTDLKNLAKTLWQNWDDYFSRITDRFKIWKSDTELNADDFVKKIKQKWEDFKLWLDKLPEKMGEIVGRIIKKIKDKFEEINWTAVGKRVAILIKDGFIKELPKIALTIQNLPALLITEVLKLSAKLWEVGYRIMQGIGKGMGNWIFGGGLKDVCNDFVRGLKNGLGIHSPAQVILDAKIGDYSMEAILLGMEKQMPKLKDEAIDIVNTLRSGVKDASVQTDFNYNIPSLNLNSMAFGTQSISGSSNMGTSVNPTIIVQVGNKQIARQVINDLQDMAKDNGSPIMIGG